MTPNDTAWTLERTLAMFRATSFTGRVDIARPELGLHEVQIAGHKLAGQLFCVRRSTESERSGLPARDAQPAWPLAVGDAYVRGGDLVAGYEPDEGWPYSPQVYWRANPLESFEGLTGSLSLLVSVQTHLLDTWPRIKIGSHLVCSESLHVTAKGSEPVHTEKLREVATIQPSRGDCCIIRRLADMPLSYVEIMPASDFRRVDVRHDDEGNCHVSWELFADFLEKGVIRRSRLHCAFVDRANDLELAAACREVIERSALPLTT